MQKISELVAKLFPKFNYTQRVIINKIKYKIEINIC